MPYRLCPCTLRQGGVGHVRIPGEAISGRKHLCCRVMKRSEGMQDVSGRREVVEVTSSVPTKLQFTFVIRAGQPRGFSPSRK